MRLIHKMKLTEHEYSHIYCEDNSIIVTLGPYKNYKSRNKDFKEIVETWRGENSGKQTKKQTLFQKIKGFFYEMLCINDK